jgi:hypothetical protein
MKSRRLLRWTANRRRYINDPTESVTASASAATRFEARADQATLREPLKESRSMEHIRRIVWKPLNWQLESADQDQPGLPPAKSEDYFVPLDGDDYTARQYLRITAMHLGKTISVSLHGIEGAEGDAVAGTPPALDIPADRVLDVVDALLFVHRRTRAHEYIDQDWTADEAEGTEGRPD